MIKQCKKCGSENLYLEPRVKGQDVMTADMVALKCKDCGNWLKWCPKDERQFYINKKQENKVEQCWVIQRDDDARYFDCIDTFYNCFFGEDEFSMFDEKKSITFYKSKQKAQEKIEWYYLKNCHPVKVEIRVVGE